MHYHVTLSKFDGQVQEELCKAETTVHYYYRCFMNGQYANFHVQKCNGEHHG